MNQTERGIQRKLKILKHADETGHVTRTCRYFRIGRTSFYRWQVALQKHGEAALPRRKPVLKSPKNRTPSEIVEKVLHLRKIHHLGPSRIVRHQGHVTTRSRRSREHAINYFAALVQDICKASPDRLESSAATMGKRPCRRNPKGKTIRKAQS